MSELIPITNCRRVTSQLWGALPYFCLKFTFGMAAGFLVNLINILSKENAEIAMSLDQLSWLASLSIISPLSSMAFGLITHHFGNRIGALLTATMFGASWLLAYYSFNATTIFASVVLAILTDAISLPSSYISEISEPQYRGTFLAILFLISAFGQFINLSLANSVYWRHIALVNLAFPVLTAVLLLATPNSPPWLARRGRLDEAEKALCRLRGWARPADVQVEFRALVENAQKSKSKHLEGATIAGREQRLRRFIRQFLRPSFYSPFATISLIFFTCFFGGSVAIQSYSLVIFRKMHSPIPEGISSILVGAFNFSGHFVILIFIGRVGKRKLALFSVAVAASCQATIATVGFLELKGEYLWIPSVAMIIALFANASGVRSIAYMLNSEIFPTSIRYIGTSLGTSVSMIMVAIVNKIFLYAVDGITLPGTFLFFAAINVVSVAVYYYAFPETDGKSLIEIEDHYNGVERLDKNEKCWFVC